MSAETNANRPRRTDFRSPLANVPVEWIEFHQWYRQMSQTARALAVSTGQWPEGTSELFINLVQSTTPLERVYGRTSGNYPPMEEILARTPEDVRRKEEAEREMLKSEAEWWDANIIPPSEEEIESTTRELKRQVDRSLEDLTDEEREVAVRRLGLSTGDQQTLKQIAKELGIPLRRVKELEASGIDKAKRAYNSDTEDRAE